MAPAVLEAVTLPAGRRPHGSALVDAFAVPERRPAARIGREPGA